MFNIDEQWWVYDRGGKANLILLFSFEDAVAWKQYLETYEPQRGPYVITVMMVNRLTGHPVAGPLPPEEKPSKKRRFAWA